MGLTCATFRAPFKHDGKVVDGSPSLVDLQGRLGHCALAVDAEDKYKACGCHAALTEMIIILIIMCNRDWKPGMLATSR